MKYINNFLNEMSEIVQMLRSDAQAIDDIVCALCATKEVHGRLFIIGMGGSAGTASHAVNDFRKIGGMDAICPLDNVSELTAWSNDVSWFDCLTRSLQVSRLCSRDALLILSGSGCTIGPDELLSSLPLFTAATWAESQKATIISIVGKEESQLLPLSTHSLVIPFCENEKMMYAYVESMHSMLLHLIVNHPELRQI